MHIIQSTIILNPLFPVMALSSVYSFVMSLLVVGKWSPLQMAPKTVVICVSSCLV